MLKKEFVGREFKSVYNDFLMHLYLVYYQNNYIYLQSNKYEILNNIPHLDYVIELTSSQMPIDYIIESTRGKKEIIPNINQKDVNSIEEHDTIFERITKMELLGFFAEVNDVLIEELKKNGFNEYEYTSVSGKKIKIEVDDLINKKIIFICNDNIEIALNNLLALSNKELIEYIGDGKDFDIINTLEEYIKSLNFNELLKIVFFHEYGHCAFYDINNNPKKKYYDLSIREKQANYYASIVLNGQYDLLIEILNNRIGKQYKNPLLKSHEYTKGIIKVEEERKKLYE